MDDSYHTPASINLRIYHHPLLHRFHFIHFPNLLMRSFLVESVNFLTYLNVLLVAAVLRRCAKQLPECMFICHRMTQIYIDTLVTNVISIKSDTVESCSA